MLFADLQMARNALEPIIHLRPPADSRLERFLDVWVAERRALAAGVSPLAFHQIATAFKMLERFVEATRTGEPLSDPLSNLDVIGNLDVGAARLWMASGMKGAVPNPPLKPTLPGTDTAHEGTAGGSC